MKIWAWVKWLWAYCPLAWLGVFSILIIVLCGIIFGKDGGFISTSVIAMSWLLGIFGHVIWEDVGDNVKKHTKKWLDRKPQ